MLYGLGPLGSAGPKAMAGSMPGFGSIKAGNIGTRAVSLKPDRPLLKPRARARSGLLWIGVLAWLATIYLVVNLRLPRVLPGEINIYVAQPMAWASLALLGYLGWRYGLEERQAFDFWLVILGLVSGLFQIALSVLAGLFLGFGRSPYSHEPLAVVGNLFYVGSMLTGLELSRAYLVTLFSKGSRLLAVLTPALLFSILSIPVARYTSLADPPSFFRFQGEVFLPAFSQSLLASFLVYLGGPTASLAYVGALQLFEWLSPVLPNLQWTVTAFLGTMAPAFSLIVIRNQVMPEEGTKQEDASYAAQPSSAWVLVMATAVALLWFNTGLFGAQPTVISGSSMNPTLLVGDVVVTREVEPGQIEVGDIVRFRQGDAFVIHRVVEIEESEGTFFFVTRGDNNNVEDPPITASQLEGKVILVIPKLGWVSIGVRQLLEGAL